MRFRDQKDSQYDNNVSKLPENTIRSRKRKEYMKVNSVKRHTSSTTNKTGQAHSVSVEETTIRSPTEECEIWTPTTVQQKLGQLIQSSELSTTLLIHGELVNYCPRNRSGHMYFDIKDENGNKLSCTMFGVNYILAPDIQECLENGVLVAVKGSIKCISKYKGSQYQCNVRKLKIVCEDPGACEQQLLEWTTQLRQEGFFDATNKRSLPLYPARLAVITSQDGAAWHDVRQTIENANIPLHVTLYPCMVQGEKCVPSILKHLETICELEDDAHKPDIVLITRGGGSREDLWEFNQPTLVRGVHAMRSIGQLPNVVCAIGHQVDTSLLDNVCDVSFITPTYAAQQLVHPFLEMQTQFSHKHQIITNKLREVLHRKHIHHTQIYNNTQEHDIHLHIRTYIQLTHRKSIHRVQQCVEAFHKNYKSVHHHIQQTHHMMLPLTQLENSHQQYHAKIQNCIQKIHQHHYTVRQNLTHAMPWSVLVNYPHLCMLQDENGNAIHLNQMKQKGQVSILCGNDLVCIEYRVV